MKKTDNPSMKQLICLTALFLLLGIIIAAAIQTNQAVNNAEEDNRTRLINYIMDMEEASSVLEEEIADIRLRIEEIHNEQAESENHLARLNNELNELNVFAGYTKVTGPGLKVVITDNTAGAELAQKNNPATYNAENFIVHDKDLLYIVKAISSEAEAISINGIRLTDTATIRCVGTVIMINSVRVAPPYEISAIGNSQRLQTVLEASGRYVSLIYKGIPVTITQETSLEIPAYSGTYNQLYIHPVSDEGVAEE